MSDLHLDEFYVDVANALTTLFSVFPRPLTLYVEDLCGPDEPDEYGVHSPRYQACFATLMWLGEEGYLRYQDTISQDAIDQAVLTSRCFNRLIAPSKQIVNIPPDVPPSVAAQQRSLVNTLRQAIKQRASAAINCAVIELLTAMDNAR